MGKQNKEIICKNCGSENPDWIYDVECSKCASGTECCSNCLPNSNDTSSDRHGGDRDMITFLCSSCLSGNLYDEEEYDDIGLCDKCNRPIIIFEEFSQCEKCSKIYCFKCIDSNTSNCIFCKKNFCVECIGKENVCLDCNQNLINRVEAEKIAKDLFIIKENILNLHREEKNLKERIIFFLKKEKKITLDVGVVEYRESKGAKIFNRNEVLAFLSEQYGDDLADEVDSKCTKIGKSVSAVYVKRMKGK